MIKANAGSFPYEGESCPMPHDHETGACPGCGVGPKGVRGTAPSPVGPRGSGEPLQFPETRTGRVSPGSPLPVRMVTQRDALVITEALRFMIRMNDLMHEVGLIAVPVGRGELERIIRDLDADEDAPSPWDGKS